MQAALQRVELNNYDALKVGDHHAHIENIEAWRQKRREEWNAQFQAHLEQVRPSAPLCACCGMRAQCKRQFCTRVSKALPYAFASHPSAPAALKQQLHQGQDYLQHLPRHCLHETAGEKTLVGLGVAVIALQLATAWASLGASLKLTALKAD